MPLATRAVLGRLLLVLVLACAGSAFGCAQTDIVAGNASLQCLHAGDCAASGVCPAARCTPIILNKPDPYSCASSQPSVRVGDGCSDSAPQQRAYRFGLCSCSDIVSTHDVTLDAWDSSTGAVVSGGVALGANGSVNLQGAVAVDGSIQAHDVQTTSSDLQVSDAILEQARAACNCHEELDTTQIVSARSADNDNAAMGVDASKLNGFQDKQTLTLGCGRYYFDRIAGSGDLQIDVTGRVQLFVQGNVELDRGWRVKLDKDASVEVFIAGTLRVSEALVLGTRADAPRVHVYVGGVGTLDLGGDVTLAGTLYAPNAELVTRGNWTSYGAVFVKRAALGGSFELHYDVTLAKPASCSDPAG